MGKFIGFMISAILGWIGGSAVGMVFTETEFVTNLFSTAGIIGAGIGLIVGIVIAVASGGKPVVNKIGEGVTETGEKIQQYYSSRFVTLKELRTESKFMFNMYSQLGMAKKDGIPIRAERIGKDTEINMYKPIHTIVIGTTGSGKTTMVIDPTIQILSETGSKPSIVVNDCKGELYNHNAEKLRRQGYDVQVIDLREPQQSSRFNPIERAFDSFQRAHNLIKEVIIHQNENPFGQNYNRLLKIPGRDYGAEWYEFNDVAYPDKLTLKNDLDALRENLINVAQEDITDIAISLCPIVGNDPSWPRGAQGFIKAIMLAMLEDSLVPELGMTKEKFNFYNVAKIAAKRDMDNPNDNLGTLRKYFEGRDKTSECVDLANTVVTNAANTAKGYLGHVTGSLSMFSDPGMCYLTKEKKIKIKRERIYKNAICLRNQKVHLRSRSQAL